jgi:hypothetical protein
MITCIPLQLRMGSSARADSDLARQRLARITAAMRAWSMLSADHAPCRMQAAGSARARPRGPRPQ